VGRERTGRGAEGRAQRFIARAVQRRCLPPDLAERAVHGRAAWTGPEHPRAGAAARRAPERGRDEMRSARRVTRGFSAARDGAAARTACRCRLFRWRALGLTRNVDHKVAAGWATIQPGGLG
jgi:hypothetical protein